MGHYWLQHHPFNMLVGSMAMLNQFLLHHSAAIDTGCLYTHHAAKTLLNQYSSLTSQSSHTYWLSLHPSCSHACWLQGSAKSVLYSYTIEQPCMLVLTQPHATSSHAWGSKVLWSLVI